MEVEDYLKIWKDCGIESIEDYRDKKKFSMLKLYMDKFSKDSLNYKNFWKAQEVLTGIDGVCNCMEDKDIDNFDIESANRRNHNLAEMNGFVGWLKLIKWNLDMRDQKMRLMEIGPGYGVLRDYLKELDPTSEYLGFDVYPKCEDVIEVEGDDGCLTDRQVEFYKDSFNVAYSVNVFQHLYHDQVQKYIDQVYEMLYDGKYAIFMCMFVVAADGWAKKSSHYGQEIDLPTYWEVDDMVRGKFKVIGKSYMPAKPFTTYNLLMEKD